MKKLILFAILLFCNLSFVNAQSFIVDDAVKGAGVHQHVYVGKRWIYGTTTNTFHNSTHSASTSSDAYLTFAFYGTGIEWYTERKNTHGIVALSIDGGLESIIDLYSSTEQHTVVYSNHSLSLGTHIIKIRSTGTKNPAATNKYLIHDYFRVFQINPPVTDPSSDNTNTFAGTSSGAYPIIGTRPFNNTGFGYHTLMNNRGEPAGKRNTAVGSGVLENSSASDNTAIGFQALGQAPSGGGNTAVGALALHTYGDGRNPLSIHGNHNTAVGYFSGPAIGIQNFTNTTSLGAGARVTASDQVRIGNTNVTSIGGQVSWSTLSDGRFKRDLREDVSGLEFINGLRPVSYNVDNTALGRFLGVDSLIDTQSSERPKNIRHTGFVAQEVDKLVKKSGYIFNGVDAPQNEKDPYTIRYAEFVVPLVKAVQEMSIKLDDQQQQITELLAQIAEKENDESKSKTELMLFQNNPNPFSVDTEIKMTLPETTASARVIVYNLEGKQLKEVTVKERGSASVKIMANELGAGMYIYALIVDGKVVDTKRMILTK